MSNKSSVDATRIAAKVAEETAAKVANEAVMVAKDVATQAAKTAAEVAIIANKTSESLLLFGQDMSYIKQDIAEIKVSLDNKYVTVDQFYPVKMIVFSGTGAVLLAVVGAIVALVIRR